MRELLLAAIQLHATPDVARNLAAADRWVRVAQARGAGIIVLPENYAGIANAGQPPPCIADPGTLETSPAIAPFLTITRSWDGILILGGQPIAAAKGQHANACLVLHRGQIVARYDKIHRFHAIMPDGALLTEADTTAPGDVPVLVDWGALRIGLGICYDLRFPEHYRALASAGAHILIGPSAFTFPTGAAHWELLLRARALENQAYMIAPAQDGHHAEGRQSWGHSMIVGPWGDILSQQSHGEGAVLATFSPAELTRVRTRLPALEHRLLNHETRARVVTLSESAHP